MENQNARYSICTITTKDLNLVERARNIRIGGITHERIYKRGLEEFEKEVEIEQKIS